jgi:ABC-type branched-subunit amino acid transport system substrate-binding protein
MVPPLLLVLLAACSQQPSSSVKPVTAMPALAASAKPAPPVPAPLPPRAASAPIGTATGGSRVGLLLPLSGASANLAAALLNASEMALFDQAGAELTLLPFDSKGTAEGAAEAVTAALAQHVEIIVGPLLAVEVRGAAPAASGVGVPLLSLSADRSVAARGIYVLGFTPGSQAIAVADYAASQGRLRQAILAPSNDYGRTVVAAVVNSAPALGITLAPVEYYDPAALDLSTPLKKLLVNRKADDAGFDALLLPDDGQRLRRVGEQWAAQGFSINSVALLGTMLWEDARPGDQFSGAWFAAAASTGFSDFARRYAKAFGAPPPRLASLAYDAVALVAVLDRRAPHDFSPALLVDPDGFSGTDGLFRLKPDGTVDRAYAIKELVPGGPPRVILPAAKYFSG